MRLDFCKLDSSDGCRRIYAVDSPTNFAAKIRSGRMMLYVFTTQEDKADVLAFLESVGWYWGE